MEKNKTGKYLKYAIGEIILVVIGILIALSINNWNKNKKSIETGELLFDQVQKELLLNIKKTNNVIEAYRGKDSLLYKVLNKKVSYEDYKSGIDLFYIVGNYVSVDATDDAYKNLIEFNGSLTTQQDSIVLKLKSLYGTDKINVDVHDKSMLNDAMILDRYQKDNMEWYYESMTFHKFSDEMIEYHLNDPFYLNEVSAYDNAALKNHFPIALNFRYKMMSIYSEISEYLNLKQDSIVSQNLKKYEHYIGTYKFKDIFTITISQEKKILKASYQSLKDKTKFGAYGNGNIIPDSKTHFTLDYQFGQLILDNNNEVTGFILSNGAYKNEFLKVK